MGPSLVSNVAFCGAEPGFKEATDLCSGFEVVKEAEADVAKDFPPTICHLGRILRAVGLVTSSFDAVETFLDAAAALLLSMDKIYRSFFIWKPEGYIKKRGLAKVLLSVLSLLVPKAKSLSLSKGEATLEDVISASTASLESIETCSWSSVFL